MKFAIVVGKFYEDLAERLVAGAQGVFGGDADVYEVPGAFELPLAAQYVAETGRYAGVACLGAVIRGETDHYDYVCAEAARGIMKVSLKTGIPCAFGVLTVENMDQALARTGGGKRDQGAHAAEAVMTLGEAQDVALAPRPLRGRGAPRVRSSASPRRLDAMLERRSLLLAAGAGTLPGRVRGRLHGRTRPGRASRARTSRCSTRLLAFEHLEAAFYRAAAAQDPTRAVLGELAAQEAAHVEALTRSIRGAGGRPVAAPGRPAAAAGPATRCPRSRCGSRSAAPRPRSRSSPGSRTPGCWPRGCRCTPPRPGT